MDFDSDSGDFDIDGDADYEMDDSGELEMEFETEAEEGQDLDLQPDSDVDAQYDLSCYDIEGAWQVENMWESNVEIGFPYETGEDDTIQITGPRDQPEPDEVTEEEREALEILASQTPKATNSGGYNSEHDGDSDDEDDETFFEKLKRLLWG